MSPIFVSQSRKDTDFIQKIIDALAMSDPGVWTEGKSVSQGEAWKQEIYRGVEARLP